MLGYTDYPINGKEGLYEVVVLSYDRNKYCSVCTENGDYEEIKLGYIWRDKELSKHFSLSLLHQLPYTVDGEYLTKKEAHKEVMKIKRNKRTEYIVYTQNNKYKFFTLKDALRCIALQEDCRLNKDISGGYCSHFITILRKVNNQYIAYIDRKGRSIIKQKHIKFINMFSKGN